MSPYRLLFDQVLVHRDPEAMHHQAIAAVHLASPIARAVTPVVGFPGKPVHAMGLSFPNAIGLAAGFDKNGVGIDALGAVGFGHVEIGTVTAEAQPGNPQPRLFRLASDRAIINRMGFNNEGAEVVAERLAHRRRRPKGPVLGINIGKTKVVDEEDQKAVEADYGKSTRLLAPFADYLVINVSSPNTPGLRSLQAADRLEPLIRHVRKVADSVTKRRVPLLVKIAPDLSDDDLEKVADVALHTGIDGVIATNTTIARGGLRSHPADVEACGAGGLSGPPVAARALEVLGLLRQQVGQRLTLIGVGGITTVDDAKARLAAGADLVQGYTALIYEGPLWPRTIARGLQ